jgi:hypothetical protein
MPRRRMRVGTSSEIPEIVSAPRASRRMRPGFQPYGEPVRRLFLLRAVVLLDLVVSGDHLRAPPSQPRHFTHALGRCALAFDQKFSQQFVQPHQAHFRFRERGKVQQVGELFLVAPFRIRLRGPDHAHAALFENAHDVVRGSFSGSRAKLRNQPSADLFDFRGSKARLAQSARGFQDQILLAGGFAGLVFLGAAGSQDRPQRCTFLGAGSAAAASRASSLRSLATLRLCSASVALKKWPPWSLATKNR